MRNVVEIAQFPIEQREEVERFLRRLDDRTQRFTFQTFDDNADRKDSRLARVWHGTLSEHYPDLVDYSRRGAGVFVCINATNLKRRTKESIVEVRCYSADLDSSPLENIKLLGLVPNIITETSPRRYGVFYNIADAPLDAEHFKRTQQSLAKLFGSDPSVCDLPRVMRLPGFPHQKDPRHPFVTRIVGAIDDTTRVYAEADFQQALAKALAAREPRARLVDRLAAGFEKPCPDFSEGYSEGQRNKECARRAGSCLARGMTDDETLAECLRWNEKNTPPLAESEVRATVASIAGRHVRNQFARASVIGASPSPFENGRFVFDGDVCIEPPKMLVKRLLPATGIAFIGGQSSAGKTFIAIALGVSLASGTDFFEHRTRGCVGVAYVAAEGQSVFGQRLAAAKIFSGIKEPIPFAWCGSVPALTTQLGLDAFIAQLRGADRVMQERFGVRLGAVFIDTVKACFDMQDENSNAEVARICNVIRYIGDTVGATMIPIHHYGKDAGTGLRGGSAWRGAADVVISVLADIDQLSGRVSNRGIAVAKARDGEQGPIAPFILEWVKLGVDEDGEDFGTCIVKADPERGLKDLVRGKAEKGLQAFEDACRFALGEKSEEVQLRTGDPKIRAVDIGHVRTKFFQRYVTGEGDTIKAQGAARRAWTRALKKVPSEYAIGKGQDGREWLWLKTTSIGGIKYARGQINLNQGTPRDAGHRDTP